MAGLNLEQWKNEVDDLLNRLESTPPAQQEIEALAVAHLNRLVSACRYGDETGLDQCIAQLRTFWLNGVPWCSELSRSLERVLMQYEEILDIGHILHERLTRM